MCLVTQLCLTLCDPMDCSPLGASVNGILQARTLQWDAIPFSGDPSNPVITLGLLHYGQILTMWATREAQIYIHNGTFVLPGLQLPNVINDTWHRQWRKFKAKTRFPAALLSQNSIVSPKCTHFKQSQKFPKLGWKWILFKISNDNVYSWKASDVVFSDWNSRHIAPF